MNIQFDIRDSETWRDVVERILTNASDEDKQHCLSFYDEMAKRGNKTEKEIAAIALFHRGLFPRDEPTPGPWEWSKVDSSTTMLLGLGQDGVCGSILEVSGCRACATRDRNCAINGTRHDLAIIESAPELYSLMKECIRQMEWMVNYDDSNRSDMTIILEKSRNLLGKIENEADPKDKETLF